MSGGRDASIQPNTAQNMLDSFKTEYLWRFWRNFDVSTTKWSRRDLEYRSFTDSENQRSRDRKPSCRGLHLQFLQLQIESSWRYWFRDYTSRKEPSRDFEQPRFSTSKRNQSRSRDQKSKVWWNECIALNSHARTVTKHKNSNPIVWPWVSSVEYCDANVAALPIPRAVKWPEGHLAAGFISNLCGSNLKALGNTCLLLTLERMIEHRPWFSSVFRLRKTRRSHVTQKASFMETSAYPWIRMQKRSQCWKMSIPKV